MNAPIKLNDTDKTGISAKTLVGGKGHGLLEITKCFLPCPETWVVPATIFTQFTTSLPGYLEQSDLKAYIDKFVSKVLQEGLQELPEGLYAVRSSALVEDSAEHSFAGMFESKLNICNAEIPQAVAQVWLSGLGKRVREYSKSREWPEMAVLIQRMVASRFSGVCFSQHPSPGTLSQNGNYLIELVSGIGEQLVQGTVTPIQLTGTYGSLANCTEYRWMPQLLDAVSRLEVSTGGPVDVEFAVDAADQLWLLQQRPVTKLSSSLTLDLRGYKKAYKRALCSLDIEFLIDGCARHLPWYLEVPVDFISWMVMLTNEKDGQQELWINELVNSAVIRCIDERLRADKRYMDRLKTRYNHYHRGILNWSHTAWADEGLPLDTRLQDFFDFILPLNAHYYAPMLIIEALSLSMLNIMIKVDPDNAEDDFFKLSSFGVSTLANDFSAELAQTKGLIEQEMGFIPQTIAQLSKRQVEKIEQLIEKYGFLNCHQPYEKPYSAEYVFSLIQTIDMKDTLVTPVNRAIIETYSTQVEWVYLYSSFVHWLNLRNRQMEYLYYAYSKAAPLLTLVGEKLGLSLEEVWNSTRTVLLNSLQHSTGVQQPYRRNRLALVHNGSEVIARDDLTILYPDSGICASTLKGRTVFASGELVGIVKVAFTPEQLVAVGSLEGIILVTGMTTPDFIPLLKGAAGLITDEGGILCHAAIIAREIRIPSIVATGNGTERLQDGMKVKMDLDRGEITIASVP